MKSTQYFIILILLTIIAISCSSTEVTLFDELKNMNGKGPIKVLTEDSVTYSFQKFKYNDTSIYGFAEIVKNNIVLKHDVKLNFRKIVHIEKFTVDGWKIVWVSLGAITIVSVATLIQPDEFTIINNNHNGSCPYIYSFNGNEYSLEGEAFGISLGKQLESETGIILRNSKTVNNIIKLKITNERPETHFINNVKLFVYEIPKNKYVFVNNDNSLIGVSNVKPVKITGTVYNDRLTEIISKVDNNYLESDLSSANSQNGFEDRFFLKINQNSFSDSITLIVNAVNTDISSVVFKYLLKLLGDEYPNFIKAVDNDTEIYNSLNKILERSSLKIDVWNGENWIFTDKIFPEASAVNFSKAVRIPVFNSNDSCIKIRIRSLTDVWKIDAVFFDNAVSTEPELFSCKLISQKTDSQNKPDKNTLIGDDNEYLKLLPENSLEMVFSVPDSLSGKDFEPVVFVKGYLYECFIDTGSSPGEILSELSINTSKLNFTKAMLNDIDKILPVIYDEWIKLKYQRTLKITNSK